VPCNGDYSKSSNSLDIFLGVLYLMYAGAATSFVQRDRRSTIDRLLWGLYRNISFFILASLERQFGLSGLTISFSLIFSVVRIVMFFIIRLRVINGVIVQSLVCIWFVDL
jgi:hypothetical protein